MRFSPARRQLIFVGPDYIGGYYVERWSRLLGLRLTTGSWLCCSPTDLALNNHFMVLNLRTLSYNTNIITTMSCIVYSVSSIYHLYIRRNNVVSRMNSFFQKKKERNYFRKQSFSKHHFHFTPIIMTIRDAHNKINVINAPSNRDIRRLFVNWQNRNHGPERRRPAFISISSTAHLFTVLSARSVVVGGAIWKLAERNHGPGID